MSAFDYKTDPAWAPLVRGDEFTGDFDQACSQVAGALRRDGQATFTYHCLTSFAITIAYRPGRAGDNATLTVAVGRRLDQGAKPCCLQQPAAQRIACQHHLLDDDAEAVAYLLQQVGARLADTAS